MLFKHWFGHRPERNPPPPPPPARDAIEINLIAAQRSQAIIDLAIDGARFQSAILDVDDDAERIVIDALFPAGFVARPGQAVNVSVRLGERRQSFESRILERRLGADGEQYHLSLPPAVGCRQRRAVWRLPLPAATAAFDVGPVRYNARARDVSALGIRLELPQWLPLPVGSLLEELEFDVLGEHFRCAAAIRNLRDNSAGNTEIGAAFVDLPPLRQRLLERLLMQVQRQQLQHARRTQAATAPAFAR